ncbi:hypothetical protein SAMN03159444_03122 [Pseudomonas sp. NFACC02]|uniref:hypothetical protein n=1 Tax=Pseudomonas sp. NFACC02 TaxID=1566250 RepID=UPI0008C57C09|nr:hypothetical protein [Pseudomonas sp. NFACC02]SER06081.1 hypothetical protein SAMN03159444_03122 [Pseudomonas sp. NFACC02]
MDYIQSLILYRASIVLGGIICIYFGYRLFYVVQAKQGDFTVKTGEKLELSLKDVSPGIFFALFGAGILVFSLVNSIKITPMLPNIVLEKTAQGGTQANQSLSKPPSTPAPNPDAMLTPVITPPPTSTPPTPTPYEATAYMPKWQFDAEEITKKFNPEISVPPEMTHQTANLPHEDNEQGGLPAQL